MWPLRNIWFLTTRFLTLTYKGNTIAIASIFILPPPTSLDIAVYWKFKYDHFTAELKNQIGAPMSGLSSFSDSCLPFPIPHWVLCLCLECHPSLSTYGFVSIFPSQLANFLHEVFSDWSSLHPVPTFQLPQLTPKELMIHFSESIYTSLYNTHPSVLHLLVYKCASFIQLGISWN